MKHFISFQKRKGLFLNEGTESNRLLAMQIQTELFKYGFVCSEQLHIALGKQDQQTLTEVYNDLCKGLKTIVGESGYEPIYRNFPQSVQALSHEEFVWNAISHYWSFGTWRPEDIEFMSREFALEDVNYKEISLLTERQFDSVFTDIVYSGSSISKWDKEIVDWFIDSELAPKLEFNHITFKETKAYIGKRYLDLGKELPVRSATDVLRIYAAYCGGDEGLKDKTKFKQPKRSVKNALLRTLNECYDLEESFKTYREVWLRVLFYLNPLTSENKRLFPILASFAWKLRNNSKELKTFNSRLELAIKNKDVTIFDLLAKRKGVFMRRMNQLFQVFGMTAIDEFVKLEPTFEQLVTLYNYFADRDQEKDRAVVLANQNKSNVSTFGALEALPSEVVEEIRGKLMVQIYKKVKMKNTKKVFINRSLYYSPLATNNRASSFSISSKAIGTVEKLPEDKTLRVYCHWVEKYDIDLSAFVINQDNSVVKVGWNGDHKFGTSITYSGDNTGYAYKNAEYLDLNLNNLDGVEWVVFDARIFRGPNFNNWPNEGVLCGWMQRSKPERNNHWLPETVEHATKITSNSKSAYLCAVHVLTKNLVYLDVALDRNNIVARAADAIKMRTFLEKFVILDDGKEEVNWKKLAQGHVINLLAGSVVKTKEEADIVFDENTTWEQVARMMTEESL
jgi:hypothetical protein